MHESEIGTPDLEKRSHGRNSDLERTAEDTPN